MNHLSRKKKLHGAGKKPKVTPATLNPPKIGDFQFGASFSFIETLDLISDGPIAGLVDPKGNVLHESKISRGVYFDGTAVSITPENETEIDARRYVDRNTKITVDISSFNNLADNGADVGINTLVSEGNTTANLLLRAQQQKQQTQWKNLIDNVFPLYINTTKLNDSLPLDQSEWAHGFAGIIKTNGFYQINDFKYDTLIKTNWVNGQPRNPASNSFLFSNNSVLADADLCIGFFQKDDIISGLARGFALLSEVREVTENYFGRAFDHFFAQKDSVATTADAYCGKEFFQKILNAVNQYGPDSNGVIQNQFMYDMITHKMKQVFGTYNWRNKTAEQLYLKIFKKKQNAGYFVFYYPDRDILNGKTSVTFLDAKKVKFTFTNGSLVENRFPDVDSFIDLMMPVCDSNGAVDTNADIIGGILMFFDKDFSDFYSISDTLSYFSSTTKLALLQDYKNDLKYNYNNVLIEVRDGKEVQKPFKYFNKVHIDKSIRKSVYGSFKINGEVQRLRQQGSYNKSTLSMDSAKYDGPNTDSDQTFLKMVDGLPTNEGSNDRLRSTSKNYSDWNSNNSQFILEEEGVPVTHVINNPNVSEVFVTLQVDSLFDSVEKEFGNGKDDDKFRTGDKLPAIMNVEIQVGKILANGTHQPSDTKTYRIAALIEGATLIDIGNPNNINSPDQYKHIRDLDNLSGNADLSTPFTLPRVTNASSNNDLSSLEKRYVKVTKLSTETFSVLISKSLQFYKVTEIIPVNLQYPFSAIVGTKIDSKSFSSIPDRTFDARLKLIKIPSNYFPTKPKNSKKDKRYYDKESEFTAASADDKKIYKGDWNGDFKLGWTDNPAWVLYDLLTNARYGLGQYVEAADINKWELYKIGRFCDAVDNDGNFVGVPDGRGGLEPRYSCNILFKNNEKVFDSIQTISRLFRGQTFFRASEVSFNSERIKSPIATFNNNNVKDGVFNYSNLRRDQQFNTVEVSYLDRFENFTAKIETVEDEEDIRSRGVFKKRVDGFGVTSRAMARRIAQHLIYRTVKENQRVAFTSGLEALLCQPGDLVIVDDDLKNQKSNFGKVLDVDTDKEYIRLSGPYDSSSMTGVLTVYSPTGNESIADLDARAKTKRRRTDNFVVNESFEAGFNIYTGSYAFSGYTNGHTGDLTESILYSEYALYTGTGDNILYYNADYTGWIFGTGLFESDNHYITKDTGVQTLDQLNTGILVDYSSSASDKRGVSENDISDYLVGDLSSNSVGDYAGILNSEINLKTQSQIVSLNVTGSVGSVAGYGSYVSGVDLPQYLPFIKLGSPYRFDLKSVNDIIYKIESIRENTPNEYLVTATKFETGKFDLLEQDISPETTENTYDYNVATQIGDSIYETLDYPTNLSLTTGAGTEADTFYISGTWSPVTNNNGYEAIITLPSYATLTTGISTESVKFDNLSSVGNYSLSVKAVGDTSTSNKYLDSQYTTETSFVLYEDIEVHDKSFTKFITFR